jgi:hypothetical protein
LPILAAFDSGIDRRFRSQFMHSSTAIMFADDSLSVQSVLVQCS